MSRARLLVAAVAVVLLAAACGPGWGSPPDPTVAGPVQQIGCDRAGDHLVLTGANRLDWSCTYTGGVEIASAGTSLDCAGATIAAPATEPTTYGIYVHAPEQVALHDVIVRDCTVRGFATNVMLRRLGAEQLDEAHEYDAASSAILLDRLHVEQAVTDGIYLDWGVTGVTIRDSDVTANGAVGVYLSPGVTRTFVVDNRLTGNGFGDVDPAGVPVDVGGTTFLRLSTGREAIAVDGAYGNVIGGNTITGNSAGGVFLYRNCGEFSTENRRWWSTERNLVTGNAIADEPNGVWIASRQAENQYFMECADPTFVSGPYLAVHLDHAPRNVVIGNTFTSVRAGVRVEDDGNQVVGNTFTASDPAAQAVVVGTKLRTQVLGQPVRDTVVRDNRATITGNPTPYVWAWGQVGTVDLRNVANGAPAHVVAGTQPPIDPFLFTVRVWPA